MLKTALHVGSCCFTIALSLSCLRVVAAQGPATLIHELAPGNGSGTGSSQPSDFFALGGRTLFLASLPETGKELWVSDGTPAGTRLIRDIHPGPEGQGNALLPAAPQFVRLGAFVYFSAQDAVHGRELWRTDGTTNGTTLVLDIWPGAVASAPEALVVLGSRIYFAAADAAGELRKSQSGFIRAYAALIGVGVVVLLAWFVVARGIL